MATIDRVSACAAALVLCLLALPTSAGAARPQHADAAFFDSRSRGRAPAAAVERSRSARSRLKERLGSQAVVEVDRVTATARSIQRTDGALTAPAEGDRVDVARRWLRANDDALGITDTDVDELRVADRLTTPNGLTHVRFEQSDRGIPAFDNDVRVNARSRRPDRVGQRLAAAGAAARLGDPAARARSMLCARLQAQRGRAAGDRPSSAAPTASATRRDSRGATSPGW